MCSHCGKTFTSRRGLEDHEKYHTQEKRPFPCTVEGCQHKFIRRIHLETHMASKHQNIQPFKCPDEGCNRAYSSEAALKKHLQSRKLFVCSICGLSFAASSSLKDHENAQHHGKVYTCTCGKTFQWRQCLNKHVAKTGHAKKLVLE